MDDLDSVLRPFRDAAATALLDGVLTDQAMAELRGFVEDAQRVQMESDSHDGAEVPSMWRRGLRGALEYEAQRHVEMGSATADAWRAWAGDDLADERYALSRQFGLRAG